MLCSGVKIPNVRLSDNREREKYSCTTNLFTALKHDFSVYVTKKLWIKWQTNIAHFDRKPFQYRSLTQAMKMHNNWRENLLFGDWVDLVNSDSGNLLSKLFFLKSFCPFIRQPRFGTSVNNFTASTFNGFIHIFSHHCRRYSDLTCSNIPLGPWW